MPVDTPVNDQTISSTNFFPRAIFIATISPGGRKSDISSFKILGERMIDV